MNRWIIVLSVNFWYVNHLDFKLLICNIIVNSFSSNFNFIKVKAKMSNTNDLFSLIYIDSAAYFFLIFFHLAIYKTFIYELQYLVNKKIL